MQPLGTCTYVGTCIYQPIKLNEINCCFVSFNYVKKLTGLIGTDFKPVGTRDKITIIQFILAGGLATLGNEPRIKIFASRSNTSTSNHNFFATPIIRLRHQSFDIRFDVESQIGTPLCPNLIATLGNKPRLNKKMYNFFGTLMFFSKSGIKIIILRQCVCGGGGGPKS